jgi:hypothetical protein
MRQRMSSKSGLDEKFPGGVFESKGAGGDYVWIAALPPAGCSSKTRARRCSTRPTT